MNKHRKKPPIAKQIWSIALLVTLVAVSASAQTLATVTAGNRNEATTESAGSAGSGESVSRRSLMSANGWLATLDEGVIKALRQAWMASGDGTTSRECVVLIFRMADGSYRPKLQAFTNQYRMSTFKWNPAAIAIVHTHPNSCDPKPAEQDKRVADKYGVPNFTISISGMYVYDPATKKTSKLMNGLDWLNLPSIQMNSKGRLARERIATPGS